MVKILDLQYGGNFVGRGEEIKELKEKIENNGIVVVTGDRGIGKTNLIKVVEEDFKKQKECHHIEYGSLFSSEVSRIFLPDKIKTGASSSLTAVGFGGGFGRSWKPKELSILEYMEKSKGEIILVENAHELKEEEIKTIFAATRRNGQLKFILEIATPYKSDVQLRGGSYEVVELRGLSDKDIGEIVRRECPNFSDMIVRGIVSLSKGYPYVARSLAYICDKKKAEDGMFEFLKTLRDDDMKYNLDRIHKEVLETLSEDSQRVIKKLAVAPAILTSNLMEAFCGKEVDTSLNDIIERGILVESEEFFRTYHPLFREYLRHIQPIALKNKKDLYCEAMERVKSEFDSILILFEVLNEPDIFEGLIKQTENYDVINFVGTQTHTWGKLEQALCAWNHLLEKTKGIDKEWESIATGNIGIVYRIKGELDKALEYHEKALKLNEELDRKRGIANQLENMGIVYRIKGELDKALEYYKKALKLNEELDRKRGIANQLGNMGNVYLIKGELDKALEYYKKALKLNEELGRKEGLADQLGNTGIVYRIKGELDKALEYHEKALKLYAKLESKEGITIQLGGIGNIYFAKGELDKALEYHEKALKLNEELGRKEGLANQLGNIGNIYLAKGELDKALEYHEKALKLNEMLGRKEGLANQLENMGVVYLNRRELDKALEYFEEALGIFEELGSRIETAQTLMNIGDVFVQKGDKERALDYYREAKSLAAGSYIFEEVSKKLKRLKEEQNAKGI